MILEYHMIREDVHPPYRANPSDAGLDICYSPDTSKQSFLHPTGMFIDPGESVILPTGLKFGVPHGYMLEIKNRSSVACKKKLIVGACVVDSGYSGEILVNLINVGRRPVKIFPGDKIAQGVLIPIIPFRLFEAPIYEEPVSISKRGEGGFGSTDR